MKLPFRFIIISLFFALTGISENAMATCSVMTFEGQAAVQTNDALALLLFSNTVCPKNVFEFRHLIKSADMRIETTMVANRGFHNPSQGSFSLFELVTGRFKSIHGSIITINAGDFFFGHFTTVNDEGYLTADQHPGKGSLMIEALAWDPGKGEFNFYELRGNGKEGQWFYRGDSSDIYADNELLHRQINPEHPQFGSRLRCSACHNAGGPIMKEVYQPHNDWWEPKRKLDFGGRKPDKILKEILETLVPANNLSKNVILGVKRFNESKKFYKKRLSLSLQEQLRPLFCPVELNFRSDIFPNSENKPYIIIPLEFFIDGRLIDSESNHGIAINRTHYEYTLDKVNSHFPETNFKDADHAWLTPVKAKSDKLSIDYLLKNGVIDEKFMFDVLAIDMANPVFSSKRCALLRYLPNSLSENWKALFIRNLSQSNDKSAMELSNNMRDPLRTPAFYKQQSKLFLGQCKKKLSDSNNVEKMYYLLIQRRLEIRSSEISSNPKGQILEPGFRVIFPENKITSSKDKLNLGLECDVLDH